MKHAGLIGLIAEYDREQCSYIAALERENRELREKLDKALSQMAYFEAANDRKRLELILAGAYDGKAAGATSDEVTP